MMIVNDELDRTWEEAIVAHLNVLSQHLPGRTDKKHYKLRLVCLCAENPSKNGNHYADVRSEHLCNACSFHKTLRRWRRPELETHY
jgi:hypothetical protein